MIDFSTTIREGRKKTGQTLRELSLVFKAHPGTISRWENGHSVPPKVAQKAIIEYFSRHR